MVTARVLIVVTRGGIAQAEIRALSVGSGTKRKRMEPLNRDVQCKVSRNKSPVG
jgi:hypothetical protein